jgi:hypothetical protein
MRPKAAKTRQVIVYPPTTAPIQAFDKADVP